MKITGVVEAVGDKFNGSLKVNGVWYAFAKGKKTEVEKGSVVNLTLTEWESNGKKGFNIVDVGLSKESLAPEKVKEPSKVIPNTGRDFDKEARGKTRSQLLSALLSNPSTDTSDLNKLFEIVNKSVCFVFGD